jgi:hypothetical protein
VRVSADGHGVVEETVSLGRNERSAIAVVLPPAQRGLDVQTIPSGALVFVDGHLQHARTPASVSLSRDDFHEVRVELDGYETETRAIKPEDDAAALTINLAPATAERATLWVEGPPATEVWLDGATTGTMAPTIGMQVTTGTHAVELRSRDGALLARQSVTLARGAIVHVALDPTAQPAPAPKPRR